MACTTITAVTTPPPSPASFRVRTTGDPDPANNGLHYLYADHLGSVSAIPQANGTVQQTRYLPFGGYRAGSGPNAITSHAYTSQKAFQSTGFRAGVCTKE